MPVLAAIFSTIALPPDLGPNLALNKSYECSDPNKSGWNPGVTDGSWDEKKGSTFATGRDARFPKTLTIDLGKGHDVACVFVGTPAFGSTKTIAVSISADGRRYTEVGAHDFVLGKTDSHLYRFTPAEARYVRLAFVANHKEQVRFPADYCFITEVEVFGASGGPTQSGYGAEARELAMLELPRSPLPRDLGPNLALAKPYECDDRNPSGWHTGLNDGLWAMRRGSTFATNRTGKFPKNVTIDLRVSAKLTHVHVGVPDFGSTKTIAVSVSYDGKTFTEVGRHDFPYGKAGAHLFEFAPVLARQVRLTYLGNHPGKKRFDPAYCFTTEVEAYARSAQP